MSEGTTYVRLFDIALYAALKMMELNNGFLGRTGDNRRKLMIAGNETGNRIPDTHKKQESTI